MQNITINHTFPCYSFTDWLTDSITYVSLSMSRHRYHKVCHASIVPYRTADVQIWRTKNGKNRNWTIGSVSPDYKYCLSALKELWSAHREKGRRQLQREKDDTQANNNAAKESSKRKWLGGSTLDGSLLFSSKLSLMLIFPLIESQTRYAAIHNPCPVD